MLYMGSKARIAKYIIPIMQPYIDKADAYVEPFVGGCNMIDKVNHPMRIGNDVDEEVIEMWKALQNGITFTESFTDHEYYEVKNNSTNLAKRGYYLGCSFGGRKGAGFRNPAHKTELNVRHELRDFSNEYYRNIMKQVPNIISVNFYSMDYGKLPIDTNSVIYCDPPYRNTTKYKFQSIDYKVFDLWCSKQKDKGNIIFVSEYLGALPEENLVWYKQVVSKLGPSKRKGQQKIEALYKI